MNGPRNKGFLEAWSQRKARVRAEEEALARRKAAQEAARERDRCEAGHAGRSDDEILAELGLPDPDRLDAGDDFSAFMRAAIPERLRRRALRRLWGTDPLLANVDGLVDYGEDFTRSESAWRAVESVWHAGRERLEERRTADARAARDMGPETTNDPAAAGDDRRDDRGGQAGPNAELNPGSDPGRHFRHTHHGARKHATASVGTSPATDPASLEHGAPTPPRTRPPTRPPTRRRMRFAFDTSTEMDSTSR